MITALRALFASKKFLTAIVATLVAIGARYGLQLDPDLVMLIVGTFAAVIVGQGLQDQGKEAAKINAETVSAMGADAETDADTDAAGAPLKPASGGVTGVAILLGLVLSLGVSLQVGCKGLQAGAGRVAGNVVDCMTPAARTAIGELVPVFGAAIRNATAGDGRLDREALRATAAPLTTALTRCAFSAAIAEALRPRPLSKDAPQSSALEVDAGELRTTYELIRDAYFDGATFKLATGSL